MTTDSRNQRVARWIRPEFFDNKAYRVPPPEDVIKLDANESPYPWPNDLKAAWLDRLNALELNRYPDAPATELRNTIRETWNIPDQFDTLVANGSDECIHVTATGVGGAGRVIMAPTPTFVVYERAAAAVGSEFVGVPLTENFELDAGVMIDAIRKHNPACTYYAWPNNPTGNLFDRDTLNEVIANTDGLAIVDEAYGAFSGESYLDDLDDYDNVVIMRTLSKSGMAGLRLGVLIGDPAWINEFHKVRMPYNVNSLSQESAAFALENEGVFNAIAKEMNDERDVLMQKFQALDGLEVFPSDANFFLIRVSSAPGVEGVHGGLLARGISIKSFHKPDSPLDSCLRVSIGTPEENTKLVAAMTDIMANG